MMDRMEVWLEGMAAPAGKLLRAQDGTLAFSYSDPAARPLSLSLPVRESPFGDAQCRGYFANLVFEGPELQRVMDSYSLERGDIGGLLYHLGADCPGAVSVTPEGAGPGRRPGRFPADYDPLTPDDLSRIVLSLHSYRRLPDEIRDPSPVAGVQGKIAVVSVDGRIYLPKPGSRAPTTHILKVAPATDPGIANHEVALLDIARRCGLDAAAAELMTFPVGGVGIEALLSTRFDRSLSLEGREGTIRRIHVEDFCQALGLPPGLKYQRSSANPAHMFSAAAVSRIAAAAAAPLRFQLDFLEHTFFNLLVGNTDNHGKNASILHGDTGLTLAPLYDVVPIFMDPSVTHEFAFRHGEARFAEDLARVDLIGLASDLGFRRPAESRLVRQLTALAQGIAGLAPEIGSKLLADALHAQAKVVEKALGLGFGLAGRDWFDRVDRDEVRGRRGGWGGFS